MTADQTATNRKNANKAYAAAMKKNAELAKTIAGQVKLMSSRIDSTSFPVDWADAGEAQRLQAELQLIVDRLTGQGEYAR